MGPSAKKFYAVKAGKKPGIYNTWAECQAQIIGYSNAKLKSFLSYAEAEAFMGGGSLSPIATWGTKAPSPPPQTYYAVAVGRAPGVYTKWEEASAAIKGYSGQNYKKFFTHQEAEEYVRAWAETAYGEQRSGTDTDSGSESTHEHQHEIDEKIDLFSRLQSTRWNPGRWSATTHVAAFKELVRHCDELGMPTNAIQQVVLFINSIREANHDGAKTWKANMKNVLRQQSDITTDVVYDDFVARLGN